jgi:hypothetical protein
MPHDQNLTIHDRCVWLHTNRNKETYRISEGFHAASVLGDYQYFVRTPWSLVGSHRPCQTAQASIHVGLQVRSVVDKVALGQVFSKYLGFPCQFSSHQLLHNYWGCVVSILTASLNNQLKERWVPTFCLPSSGVPSKRRYSPTGPLGQYEHCAGCCLLLTAPPITIKI